ncbi:hypothetical protein SBF1_50023 [Candidatus Desulfosporosinus infrequens]|uniref:Uncharacterized protein n=1 Tax=Candidatus Desulfosporosinus infrequens TaxID=2043169 RepID=A0A2U3LH51_9FIRM|nr:hypothetical protein SBF1_50023 [Candidatus Desulfosporosinus infrequens]
MLTLAFCIITITSLTCICFGIEKLIKVLSEKRKKANRYKRLPDGCYHVFDKHHPLDGIEIVLEELKLAIKKLEEEPKMSNVKITYKPVDKEGQASKWLAFLYSGAITFNECMEQINAIYNANDEDGEIENVEITKDDMTLKVDRGCIDSVRVQMHGTYYVLNQKLTPQEALELGQALIKMGASSEPSEEKQAKGCTTCRNVEEGCCRQYYKCTNLNKWEPIEIKVKEKSCQNCAEAIGESCDGLRCFKYSRWRPITCYNCKSKEDNGLSRCPLCRERDLWKSPNGGN